MKKTTLFLIITALFAATSSVPVSAGVKYVAVVETEVDARSNASADLTPAEVSLMTTELRREAVNNLPRSQYNVMTSETVQAQGGAVLEECAEENCVIALGSKIGADYIVRGIISKLRTRLTLSVEIYETENGNLVASSDPVRSDNIEELVEKAAAACADMYKKFANVTTGAATPVTTPVTTAADSGKTPVINVPQTKQAKQVKQSKPSQQTYTLTTKISPQGGGYIIRNPNKETYTANEIVNVTAMSANGYMFTGYTGVVTSRANRVTVSMDGDKALTANFYKRSVTSADAATNDPAYKILSAIKAPPATAASDTYDKGAKPPKPDFESVAKNALSIDVASIPVYLVTKSLPNGDNNDVFGFGLQYERRLNDNFSIVGKYRYFSWEVKEVFLWDDWSSHVWSSHSHSFDICTRYYPTGKTLFLGGMLGYFTESNGNFEYASGTLARYVLPGPAEPYGFFKGGISLGWRVDPEILRGFIWEFSFGWVFAFNDYHDSDNKSFVADLQGGLLGGAGVSIVTALGWKF